MSYGQDIFNKTIFINTESRKTSDSAAFERFQTFRIYVPIRILIITCINGEGNHHEETGTSERDS